MTNQRINTHAAIAVALIVALVVPLVVVACGFLSAAILSSTSGSNSIDSFMFPIVLLAFLPAATIALALPLLLNSKHGWRTVVATFLYQSLALFVSLTITLVIFNSTTQTDSNLRYYNDSCINCGTTH